MADNEAVKAGQNRSSDNYFENQIEVDEPDKERDERECVDSIAKIAVQNAPITMMSYHGEVSMSKSVDLDNPEYIALSEEANYDGYTEYSNMNRLVSQILRNKKFDSNDAFSRKRRQRLTRDQLFVLESEFQKKADWS